MISYLRVKFVPDNTPTLNTYIVTEALKKTTIRPKFNPSFLPKCMTEPGPGVLATLQNQENRDISLCNMSHCSPAAFAETVKLLRKLRPWPKQKGWKPSTGIMFVKRTYWVRVQKLESQHSPIELYHVSPFFLDHCRYLVSATETPIG